MGENISTLAKTGVCVILVAFIISMVLSLTSVSQGITGKGLNLFQGGASSLASQEFEQYNQKKVYGTDVKGALSLYQGRDVSIIVRTKTCGATVWGHMYGLLLTGGSAGTTQPTKNGTGTDVYYSVPSSWLKVNAESGGYDAEVMMVNGISQFCANTKHTVMTGDIQFIVDSARFQASLVRNASGEIVGIVFEQIV